MTWGLPSLARAIVSASGYRRELPGATPPFPETSHKVGAMAVATGTLFELPEDIFDGASAVDETTSLPPRESSLTEQALQALSLADDGTSESAGGLTCAACGLGFEGRPGFPTLAAQRAHFRSDWHRYNVKRRLAGLPRVSESEFDSMLDGDAALEVGSLSGSESSDSESDDAEDERKASGALSSSSASPHLLFRSPGADSALCGIGLREGLQEWWVECCGARKTRRPRMLTLQCPHNSRHLPSQMTLRYSWVCGGRWQQSPTASRPCRSSRRSAVEAGSGSS